MEPPTQPKTQHSAIALGEVPPRLLITAQEGAAMIGVSLRQWWRLFSSGKIPRAVIIGQSKRWRPHELRRWVDAGCPERSVWDQVERENERQQLSRPNRGDSSKPR
jgi:predicted DNA-binding transcriptional regulator AlpA